MLQTKIKKYFKENLVLIILFLIASIIECAVIFPIMMNDSINYDSTYQYGLTQHTIPEIFRLLPYDYSPPFYAIALKLFTMVFGNSLAVMRTFSIFAVIGMLWMAAFPMKRIFGEKAAYTCLIITFLSFAVLSMIHEIRPTIFAMFFFMAVSVFAVEAYMLGKRSSYICFTFFAVLAMYTHNIALVGTFSVYVSLLLVSLIEKDFIKFRNFLISGIICAVLYIPWLSVLLSQISHVKDNFWVSPDGILNNIEWTLMNPFKSFHLNPLTKILILLMEICILFAFLRHINIKKIKTAKNIKEIFIKRENSDYYKSLLLLMLFLVFSILILLLIDTFVSKLASSRYCNILGMAWIILLSAIIGKADIKFSRTAMLALFCICFVKNVYDINMGVKDSNISDIRADLYEHSKDGKIVFLHLHEYSLGTLYYYFPEAEHYVCDRTFSVLRTFDVFPIKITNIGDPENIWKYADKFYIISDDLTFGNIQSVYNADDLIENNNNIKMSELFSYRMAYDVILKNIHISEAERIDEENNEP